MKNADTVQSKKLRDALLKLDASGHDGFEGLLSIALGTVTGQTFRLASSGTQQGRDGDSAFDSGATYFEAKRYDRNPGKKLIAEKLFDIQKNDSGQTDLWILGATYEVDAITAADMRKMFGSIGIGFIALDWSRNDLGKLLIAVVAAADDAKEFFDRNLIQKGDAALGTDAQAAIDYFAVHPHFPKRLEALIRSIASDQAGFGHAKSTHPHFVTHLRYFLYGADLPDAVVVAFEAQVGDPRYVTSSDVVPLGKLARDLTRNHGLDKHDAADEFFNLGIDMGLSLDTASSIRQSVMQLR